MKHFRHHMKKIAFLACAAIAAVSCSKSDNNPTHVSPYYISFTADGTPKNLTTNLLGHKEIDLVNGTITYQLLQEDSVGDAVFYITVGSRCCSTDPGVGTYKDTTSQFAIYASWDNYWAGSKVESQASASGKTILPFEISISSVTDSIITGTFQGHLYDLNDSSYTQTPVNMTDGKFNLIFH